MVPGTIPVSKFRLQLRPNNKTVFGAESSSLLVPPEAFGTGLHCLVCSNASIVSKAPRTWKLLNT
jgi:cytochrome c-type biogenesis protein CcmH/NrfF